MKTIISGAIVSPALGLFSWATTSIRPVLSDAAAVLGILVSIATLILISANVKKSNREADKAAHDEERARAQFEAWMIDRCKNCTEPENCVFKDDHKPTRCRWRAKT